MCLCEHFLRDMKSNNQIERWQVIERLYIPISRRGGSTKSIVRKV